MATLEDAAIVVAYLGALGGRDTLRFSLRFAGRRARLLIPRAVRRILGLREAAGRRSVAHLPSRCEAASTSR
jgi:hypothetical protein